LAKRTLRATGLQLAAAALCGMALVALSLPRGHVSGHYGSLDPFVRGDGMRRA
jgi:hypothetical protein